ncbi:hypothetical protein XENOCAPTIV_005897, partial [Xenoophorus captivus]
GAGGKGVWGAPGMVYEAEEPDVRDPNYDEAAQVLLKELNLGQHKYEFTSVAVSLSLEGKASHRELTSRLLSDLSGKMLTQGDMAHAFDKMVKELPDLILDTPEAPQMLGQFIARGIADHVLPMNFLDTYKGKVDCEHARRQQCMLGRDPRASALLDCCVSRAFCPLRSVPCKHEDTGEANAHLLFVCCSFVLITVTTPSSGVLRFIKYCASFRPLDCPVKLDVISFDCGPHLFLLQMNLLLKEYLISGDVSEAEHCLRDLEVPHFHHELVYEGFQRVYDELHEICLDVPHAHPIMEAFVDLCYQESVITKQLRDACPFRLKGRMGRQRKRVVTGDAPPHSRRDERPAALNRKEKKKKPDIGKLFINISIGLCIFSLIWFFYAIYMRSSLSKRVVTLHPSPRVLDANSTTAEVSSERFWGSYRPQVYFGMKTRSPRHTCEQGDHLQGYSWLMHDGLTFGVQEIRDNDFTLTTEFVKRIGGDHGGDWTWRITAKQHSSAPQPPVISLIFYAAADIQGSLHTHMEERHRLASITGFSEELGNFKITFRKPVTGELSSTKYASYNYLQTLSPGLEKLTDIVKLSLNRRFVYSPPSGEKRHYIGVDTYKPPHHQNQQKPADPRKESDFVVHQVTVQTPFQIEVLFESGSFYNRPNQLVGSIMTQELERRKAEFNVKFEKIFGLESKGFSQTYIKFAKAALSNMLGGMGYFYGESVVQSVYNEYPILYPEGALFTAVPSRSFFPRGFLWDEGFHQLLLSKWDPQLTREAIGHWFDLMNIEGWIPREQILGDEARSKVPAEFIVQRNENANPPTLFLALQELIGQLSSRSDEAASKPTLPFLRRLFPRLKTWFQWYNTTQTGPKPNSYRWRGRDKDTNLYLNPKTLTSGLDDYPRASHPSADERHVDLHCWMALSSGIMASIAQLLGEPHEDYKLLHDVLRDNNLLNDLHWSEQLHAFSDYGNHTQNVSLQREKVYVPPGQPRHQFPVARLVRSVRRAPKLQYVNALGYVSLFPFLLQILQPDSPKLEHILRDMRDPNKLWTPFGLRSLSKTDPLYMERNTEHDPPYWRGPVWININYLAVRALYHYGNTEGPYQEKAADVYKELRTNIINNVYTQYVETGYIWEQYNDSTGRGQGSHPFTGWSSLTVLMMAEHY